MSGEGPTTAHTSQNHTNTGSKPQPEEARTCNHRPAKHHTRTHTHTNTRRKHTHTRSTTNTDTTNTQHTHQHRHHAHTPRRKHTQHGKPSTQPHGNGRRHGRRTQARVAGTAPRTLRQDWRGATNHKHQRAPQPGVAGDRTRGPQPGVARERPARTHSQKTTNQQTSARSGEAPPPEHHQRTPASGGGEPRPRPSARSGEGPPATTIGEPQPGMAGTRTQAPQQGVKRSRPPNTTTAPQPGVAEDPPPHQTQREGGTGRKGPTGDAGEGPNLRGLGAPEVTVSAPPEHTQ